MHFNIVSNLANGVGLQQDYLLLRHELEKRGHTTRGVQFNAKPLVIHPADVNIFLEVVTLQAFSAAKEQWAVPNPEWWFAEWYQYPWTRVLAKTRDCERIFKDRLGDKCQYLGWMARDLYNPNIPRQRRFLHVQGKSSFKNTQAVIAGCAHAQVPLTVIGQQTGNRLRVSDEEMKTLMNSHFCQVMPSAYEGYGHVLHEALGVGQVVITTNAPPMNEVMPAVLVPSISNSPYHSGTLHKVSPLDIARAVKQVMALSPESTAWHSEHARAQFHRERQEFLGALDSLVGGV